MDFDDTRFTQILDTLEMFVLLAVFRAVHMESTERVVVSRSDSIVSARARQSRRPFRAPSNVRLDGTVFVHVCRAQVGIRAVSELCH